MSLLCERCQQAKATVHITDTVPQKQERHLCEDCAEKEGVIIKQPHPTSNEILQQFLKHKAGLSRSEDLTCSRCGTTFREFQTKGQLGCPHDYEAFRKVLMPLIERAHEGAAQHVGKVPSTAGETVRKQAGLMRLRRQLQDAVEQEDYEVAARVRDQIRALESG
jgi:protein arginine kinase activator